MKAKQLVLNLPIEDKRRMLEGARVVYALPADEEKLIDEMVRLWETGKMLPKINWKS